MEISDLDPVDSEARERCAQLLVEEFREIAPDAWPNISKARETVVECLQSGPVRVARIEQTIVGWIGGRHAYSRVWELHPLVVARTTQKRGIGSALVADLERIVAVRGAMTLILGSDDEVGLTSLAGLELYPDPLAHLARLQDRGGHAFTFYLRCGFVVTSEGATASVPHRAQIAELLEFSTSDIRGCARMRKRCCS